MPAQVFSLHGSGDAGLASTKPSKKRALKYEKGLQRPKDTHAPKKPLTGYFQWAGENREGVKKELGTSKPAEVSKKLAEKWKALPQETKDPYESSYKKKLEVWKKLMVAYRRTTEHQDYNKNLRDYNIKMTYKPFKKDENMPKRPLSAYMLFAGDERAKVVEQNADAKVTEIMGLIAKAWKDLSDEAKKPYIKKAKSEAAKHAKEVEAYKQKPEHSQYLDEKRAYEERMAAKRNRLLKLTAKQLEEEGVDTTESENGEGPKPKRAKISDSKNEKKKKKSDSKKKGDSKKRDDSKKPKAKKASDPKKPKGGSKKKGEPKAKSDSKKTKKTNDPKNSKTDNKKRKGTGSKTSGRNVRRKASKK